MNLGRNGGVISSFGCKKKQGSFQTSQCIDDKNEPFIFLSPGNELPDDGSFSLLCDDFNKIDTGHSYVKLLVFQGLKIDGLTQGVVNPDRSQILFTLDLEDTGAWVGYAVEGIKI